MYPELRELHNLERETLKCISEVGEFGRLKGVQEAARDAARALESDRASVDVHLNFTLEIRLGKELSQRRIDLGAVVRQTANRKSIASTSYSIVICRKDSPKRSPILRKFHFDYEPISERNHAEPKPSIHLQMCGKFSPQHLTAGYEEIRIKALYPQFEKPRIPCQPTSIALLLNWLFLEFQSDIASQAVLKNPRWQKLVAAAERTVLVPYFDLAANFLRSTGHREKQFLQTHLYEIPAA